MRYTTVHTTSYTYNHPVQLDTHVLRLRPRSDVSQSLLSCDIHIEPQPQKMIETVELDGNSILYLWFGSDTITELKIHVASEVETFRTNPFDYLLERWATQLPIDYPESLRTQLHPYLQTNGATFATTVDPVAIALAQDIYQAVDGNTVLFVGELNQRIYDQCEYSIRETGDPQSPGVTWSTRSGSCRDFAVLFIEVCRAVHLAARFVSGYQEGDPDATDRHLHAWAEVYLPGAGWRGYDPTHGLAVSDRHIALVASAFPRYAAPLTGRLLPGSNAKATMSYRLSIQVNHSP